MLRALAHLLEHLCSWFNVTLGEPLSLRALVVEQCDRSCGKPLPTQMPSHNIDACAHGSNRRKCLPSLSCSGDSSAQRKSDVTCHRRYC